MARRGRPAGESARLKAAWSCLPPDFLDLYLVQGVENPCINPQSVVVRARLAEWLQPGAHGDLAAAEALFAACACTLLQASAVRPGAFNIDSWTPESFSPPLSLAEERGPRSCSELCKRLREAATAGSETFTSPFESLWRKRLERAGSPSTRLLEIACGSANDSRYFRRYGLDHLWKYVGLDLCGANVVNARRRCAEADFLQGDALRLPFRNGAFDGLLAFDLFEHLSIEALQVALGEAARVTRHVMWLSFFQLDRMGHHVVVPDGPYHRNVLSAPRLLDALSQWGWTGRVLDVGADWALQFPGYRHHNPRGRIIEARRR